MVSNFTINDINEINELGKFLNPNFIRLFHIDKLNNNEKIYVYKEDNQVLGFIHININYEIAEILNIITKDEYRNKGIATLLLDYMITDLPNTIDKILLEVNENNKDAIKLYYKFNFEIINIRKNYYQDGNGLVMERNLK